MSYSSSDDSDNEETLSNMSTSDDEEDESSIRQPVKKNKQFRQKKPDSKYTSLIKLDTPSKIDTLEGIENLLSTNESKIEQFEKIALPTKYMKKDPSCIRKYSNFSYPKEYSEYNLIDYYPTKKIMNYADINITNSEKLKDYINYKRNQDIINSNVLEETSPKLKELLDNIERLDQEDLERDGTYYKHFIFSDVKNSLSGVKLIASGLISRGFNLGYSAEPKYTNKGKKWGKLTLKSNKELLETPFQNFYMLSSKTLYDDSINTATKKEILSRFNERPINNYGDMTRFILMDGGFKEGIDLFDIKYVHLFEPTVTAADQKQAIGRGTRTCGQRGLDFHPTMGWPLHVFIYDLDLSDYNNILGESSGIELLLNSMGLNVNLLNFTAELENVCVETSVDMELNKNIHSFKIGNVSGGAKSKISHPSPKEEEFDFENPPNVRMLEDPPSWARMPPPLINGSRRTGEMSFHEMKSYVKNNFGNEKYHWTNLKMENLCPVPENERIHKGGAKSGNIINFTPTQTFIKDYFTPTLPLKGMLLWHSVGTGKTCSAIAAASSFEKSGYTILWVTRTTLKNDIWKNMFDQVCSLSIQQRIKEEGLKIPADNSARMRLLPKNWKIRPMSYKQFSNLVSQENQIYNEMVKINGVQDPLRKTLIIIDEAHKLYGGGDLSSLETPDMVKFHASLMNSYTVSGNDSVRLLIMTATPIQNDPMELIKLINLTKVPDDQFPSIFTDFSEKYLKEDGTFTGQGLNLFKDEIAGHISYLNREKDARQFSQPVIHNVEVPVLKENVMKRNQDFNIKLVKRTINNLKDKISEIKKNEVTRKEKTKKQLLELEKIKHNKCKLSKIKKFKTPCNKFVSNKIKEIRKTLKQNSKQEQSQIKDSISNLKEEIKGIKDNPQVSAADNNITVLGRLITSCIKPVKTKVELENIIDHNNIQGESGEMLRDIKDLNTEKNTLSEVIKKTKSSKEKDNIKNRIKEITKSLENKKDFLKKFKKDYSKNVKKSIKLAKQNVRSTLKRRKEILKTLKSTDRELPLSDMESTKDIISEVNDLEAHHLEEVNKKIREKEEAKLAKVEAKEQAKQEKLQAKEREKQSKLQEKEREKQEKLQAKEREKQEKLHAKEMLKEEKKRIAEEKKEETRRRKLETSANKTRKR